MLITLSASGSSRVWFAAQKLQASWLFVMTHNLPEQSNWCDKMPIRSYDYSLYSLVSRPFSPLVFDRILVSSPDPPRPRPVGKLERKKEGGSGK